MVPPAVSVGLGVLFLGLIRGQLIDDRYTLMSNSVDLTIEALRDFVPSEDDTDNVHRLYQIFEEFRTVSGKERALSVMFALMERFPDADLGSPGPIVHELEAIAGYQAMLRDSLRRRPTHLTVWMVNRILNSQLDEAERKSWLNALREASNHPLASELAKEDSQEFLRHQAEKTEG